MRHDEADVGIAAEHAGIEQVGKGVRRLERHVHQRGRASPGAAVGVRVGEHDGTAAVQLGPQGLQPRIAEADVVVSALHREAVGMQLVRGTGDLRQARLRVVGRQRGQQAEAVRVLAHEPSAIVVGLPQLRHVRRDVAQHLHLDAGAVHVGEGRSRVPAHRFVDAPARLPELPGDLLLRFGRRRREKVAVNVDPVIHQHALSSLALAVRPR